MTELWENHKEKEENIKNNIKWKKTIFNMFCVTAPLGYFILFISTSILIV